MLVHVDSMKFSSKPVGNEIGGIKARFTKKGSIQNLSVSEIAERLQAGHTIQPGVTPFSERNRQKGKTGTCDDDFREQTLFMTDIDNKRKDAPKETPTHAKEALQQYNIPLAFAYPTFNSTPDNERFRLAVVCDEVITDRAERNSIQAAFIKLFAQSDPECINADRIFFGTDKGIYADVGDMNAVCRKAALLAFAKAMQTERQPETEKKPKFGETIPTGQRHGTLVSFASTVLTKYGAEDGKAYELFMQRVAQCEEPKPDAEIQKIWRDACKHYEKTIKANPDYLSPAAYVAAEFAKSVEPMDYTDVGQANLFVSHYGEKVRYSAATKWLVYDGKKWNESELQAQGLAQELTERQLVEARKRVKKARAELDKAIESGDDDKQEEAKAAVKAAEGFRSYVLGRRKTSRISATLTEARPAVEISVTELDKDGFMLNTPGGTVDLRTGKMHPHNPLDYCTKMTAATPTYKGMETWLAFLDRLTCGDKDLQEYLQICSGMEAVGNVYVENLCIAYGRGGNGKSTYYNAKARVMGDYYGSLSAETLTANCRKNKSPEYAELRGKRLVIAAELEEGMRLDTAIVKKLCSTDPIKAEKKFKDPFDFIPSHTTILYTNHLPKVGTNDSGTWDRLVVVPFNARFRGEKGEILNYTEYLFENCGGAILAWIIEGARKFIAAEKHIVQPECVKRAIAEYRNDNDWLKTYLEECCEVSPEYSVRACDLFDAYRTHCNNAHEWPRNAGDFKAAVTGAGFKWRKVTAGAFYFGLKLKSEFEPIVPL